MNKIMNKKSIMIETVNYLNQLIEISSLIEELCVMKYCTDIQLGVVSAIKVYTYRHYSGYFQKIDSFITKIINNSELISEISSSTNLKNLKNWQTNMNQTSGFYGWLKTVLDSDATTTGSARFLRAATIGLNGYYYCSSSMYQDIGSNTITYSLSDIAVNLRNEIIIDIGVSQIKREVIRTSNKVVLGIDDIENRIIKIRTYVTQKLLGDNNSGAISSQKDVIYMLNGEILYNCFALYQLLKLSNQSSTYITNFYNWVDGYCNYVKSTEPGKYPTEVPNSGTTFLLTQLKADYSSDSNSWYFIVPESSSHKTHSLVSVLKDLKNNI